MSLKDTERKIAGMEQSLNHEKATVLMFSDDSAFTELGMLTRKIGTTVARRDAGFDSLFFADIDEGDSEPTQFRP